MTNSSKKKKNSGKKKKPRAPSTPRKARVTATPRVKRVTAPRKRESPKDPESPVLEPKRFGRNDTVWYQTPGMKFPMAAWVIRVNNVAHTAVIETLNDVRDPVRYTVRTEYLRYRKLPER